MVHHSAVSGTDEWRIADLVALAMEHAPAQCVATFGVVLQSGSGAIVAATPSAADILGLTSEQMRGRTLPDPRWATVDEQLRPLDGSRHPSMRALASGRPVRDVVLGVHRPHADSAGRHVWLSVTSVPIRPTGEGPPVVLTAFSMLSGPRTAELQLMESEANFHFIAENSSDMVAWQRFDTTYLWVSPASTALLGWSPEELVGTRSLDLVHPDDLPRSLAVQRAIAAGATHMSIIRRFRHAAGHHVWVETTLRVAAGQTASVAHMQTSSRNVDDRIAAQHAQAEAEASRDSAVRLFRTAMEHAAIGMAIRSLDGRLVEVNGALCTMLGRSATELKGSALLEYTHPDDVASAGAARAVLLSGRAVTHDSERRYLRSDGAVRWVQAT